LKIFPFSRFIIEERSMLPAYSPGEHVLTFNWGRIGKGDVVVFRESSRFFVKRVKSVRSGLFLVGGDNKSESAKAGYVSKEGIVGKVVLKY